MPLLTTYSLSRGAPSATWVLLQMLADHCFQYKNVLYRAEKVGFEPTAPYGVTGFQDRLLKPLGHLSITVPKHSITFTQSCQAVFLIFLSFFQTRCRSCERLHNINKSGQICQYLFFHFFNFFFGRFLRFLTGNIPRPADPPA